MIILRPKNVTFERFWPLSKFHFPACSTLNMTLIDVKTSSSTHDGYCVDNARRRITIQTYVVPFSTFKLTTQSIALQRDIFKKEVEIFLRPKPYVTILVTLFLFRRQNVITR